jgi:type I restriction-modification system DNA methylase subunit
MKIEDLIKHYRFSTGNNQLFRKFFPASNCEMLIDLSNKTLHYPESNGLIVNDRNICSFRFQENFVLFDCVTRLLSIGYCPEHIELQPRWRVGHGASGGFADIMVKDKTGKSLIIIECKKYGTEFDKEWNRMLLNGGQAFGYLQQDRATRFICLFASDIVDKRSVYRSNIIPVTDNGEYLMSLDNPRTYSGATDMKELHATWKETYHLEYDTYGIFDNDSVPYVIGKARRTASDLKDMTHDDVQKLYQAFTSILRQHNVSSRENAFDKLLNLLLAKITDETTNPGDLQFCWRGFAADDYFSLQDRIQKLYRTGMKIFLNQKVSYVDDEMIIRAFPAFGTEPDATRETVQHFFRELKFFSENDFTFIDVHNRSLFCQNAEILLKTVRMLQDIRVISGEQNQFLGDLFEFFLDDGVRQCEGQYFTPVPITRFLVSSLPLKSLAESSSEPLKAIDFACGAGHFLNEYAAQISAVVPREEIHRYSRAITGIEKESRLSKVSSVSSFMYGHGHMTVFFGDALSGSTPVNNSSFDVLVSNPPYGVKGFLESVSRSDLARFTVAGSFEEMNRETSACIEVLFVERAAQLLAPGGVAAVILPASILSNRTAAYVETRKLILESFDIVALAEFGASTFGRTNARTVSFFLRRKCATSPQPELFRTVVSDWLSGVFDMEYPFPVGGIIDTYCEHMGFDPDMYRKFLKSVPSEMLFQTKIFRYYRTEFDKSPEIRTLVKRKKFSKKDSSSRMAVLDGIFLNYSRTIERHKLYYFLLAHAVTRPVALVSSPMSPSDEKLFLGYEWSTAKDREGIRYLNDAGTETDVPQKGLSAGISGIVTPLFDPRNFYAEGRINTAIRNNFLGFDLPATEHVVFRRLVDIIDFEGVKPDFTMSMSVTVSDPIPGRFPRVALEEVCFPDTAHDGDADRPMRRRKGHNKDMDLGAGMNLNLNQNLDQDHDHDQDKERKRERDEIEDEPSLLPFISLADIGKDGEISPRRSGKPAPNETIYRFGTGHVLLPRLISSLNKIAMPSFEGRCGYHLVPLAVRESVERHYLFLVLRDRSTVEFISGSKAGAQMPSVDLGRLMKFTIPLPPLDAQREFVSACAAVDDEMTLVRGSIAMIGTETERVFLEMMDGPGPLRNWSLSDSESFSVSVGRRVTLRGLDPDGSVPVYSSNVSEPLGFVSNHLLPDYGMPSVLWGSDSSWNVNYIPENVPFYPTDHCGVIRVKTPHVVARCLAWAFERNGASQGFSREFRASREEIRKLSLTLPSLEEQTRAASTVLGLDAQAADALSRLRDLETRKAAMLTDFLSDDQSRDSGK